MSGKHGGGKERREKLTCLGLHFCRRYGNLVRYNPEFCGRCPFNGLRRAPGVDSPGETCF